MKKILITGGAGFIGSRLTEALYQKGYTITILDNLSSQIHGSRENSLLYHRVKKISNFIKGDVRNKDDWKLALKDNDIIIHLASLTGTGQSMYEIDEYNEVNVMGTSHLLSSLMTSKHQVKKIIVASSRAVYGEGKYKCIDHGIQFPNKRLELDMKNGQFNNKCLECSKIIDPLPTDETARINPSSIYAITKYQQEAMIMLMGDYLNIPSVILRYQNVYGPGQSLINPYTGILSVFSTRLLNGNNIEVYEDGLESRDFIYIDDVIRATILSTEKDQCNGEILNIGSGSPVTVNEVAKLLKKLYNSQSRITINGKFRLGDIRHNFADISKSNRLLGFYPETLFEQGIKNFVDWVQTQDIYEDNYEKSLKELDEKGFIK